MARTTYCLLVTSYYLLLARITYYLLLTTYYLPLTTHHLPLNTTAGPLVQLASGESVLGRAPERQAPEISPVYPHLYGIAGQ